MKAKESKILRLIDGSDKKFIVPVYQRPYSWKKDDCDQLLKDLMDVYENGYESHFFGSIVFVAQQDGVVDEHMIIDGQQRITTVSLLLLAIRNYVISHPELNLRINPEKIMNAYLTDQYSDNDKKLKLKLVQGDDEAYDNLIENKISVENTGITVNYNYFYNKLKEMDPDQIEGLYEAISKLDIVSISLEPQIGDDPQLIFESLNSTGQALEPVDKIRNFVLMGMNSAKQEKFYRNYWEPLEKMCAKSEINSFIRYFLAVKLRRLPNESKLYFEFKHYYSQSGQSMETILEDMLEYAKYYILAYNPGGSNSEYKAVLLRINSLGIKACYPLLMDLLKANNDGYISDEDTQQALEIVENYIVRREICNLPTNALNKVFVQLGSDIEKNMEDDDASYFNAFKHQIMRKTGRSRFPNNRDFADKFTTFDLYNSKLSIKKYILERLENFHNKEQVAVEELISDQTLTIEHIMPQTLTDEWKDMLGDNWELVYTKYLHTIGNLTLTAYNSDYSNSSFQKKKTMPEKGFLYSKLSLNDYVRKCDTWGEKEILERADLLYEKAEKIWWIPEDDEIKVEDEEWYDWDEEFDITNKRVAQIIILDTIINTKDMTDAYEKINSLLYDLDPTLYQNSELTWFGCSEEAFKGRPYKIAENAFIETNRSSLEKMNYIKRIAEIFELSSEDIRFLVQSKTQKDTFDIHDERTYASVTVGKLAYLLFSDLIENDLINDQEVEELKDRKYTKSLFDKTDYPALATSRDAYRGNSQHIRYRKKPLVYKGNMIYITTQWFEENRPDLISWYKQHLGGDT